MKANELGSYVPVKPEDMFENGELLIPEQVGH